MDKTILVTGASSGIGLATAIGLKQKGFRVFATARKEADLTNLNALGLEGIQLDVNNSQSIKQAVNEVLTKTNQELFALFNNAGYVQFGAIEDLTREMLRNQFETNVFGPMELIRLLLPVMRRQGYGRIIQNSSILGVITLPYYGAYSASKYALEGLSATLRQELRGTNIFVSLINPGPIKSKLFDNAFNLYNTTLRENHSDHLDAAYQQLEQSFQTTGQGRFVKGPDAVLKAVLKALTSKRPKTHYFVTLPAQVMGVLRRFLPDRTLDWLLSKSR